jgi:hypothetical protein
MLVLIILNFLVKLGWVKPPDRLMRFLHKLKRLRWVKPGFFVLLLIGFAAVSLSFTYKSQDLPIPKGVTHQLFYLQRDPDANTVVYKLNMVNGELNETEPVAGFWIRYAEDGRIKELSSMQKRLAYGIQSRKIDRDKHELNFVSYPDLKLLLMKSSQDESYHVYTAIEKQQIVLEKIFVRTNKNKIGWPSVIYIELNGKALENGKSIKHRIYL